MDEGGAEEEEEEGGPRPVEGLSLIHIYKKSDQLDMQQEKIVRLEEKFDSLTHSLQGLTKALWGMSGAIVSVLLGFFIWYVQTL